jgi:hypothetical protein
MIWVVKLIALHAVYVDLVEGFNLLLNAALSGLFCHLIPTNAELPHKKVT